MADRYNRLFTLPSNLYYEGSPVIISAGALLHDTVTGGVLAQLKFQNISLQTIIALSVVITAYDPAGVQLEEAIEFQYLDLSAKRGDLFGQKVPIRIPNPSARSFSVAVSRVVFDDHSLWECTSKDWSTLPEGVALEEKLHNDAPMIKEFRSVYSEKSVYWPLDYKGLTLCPCGTWNKSGLPSCTNCTGNLTNLPSITEDGLQASIKTKRIEEARKLFEKEKKVGRTVKILLVVLSVVFLLTISIGYIFGVLIPQKKLDHYNAGVKLMNQGDYSGAIAELEEADGLNDSNELIKNAIQMLSKQEAERLLQDYYDSGQKKYESGDYLGAIDDFILAGENKRYSEIILDCYYLAAEKALAQNNYVEAADNYLNCIRFRDSAQKAFDCCVALIENKSYPDADELLIKLRNSLVSSQDVSFRKKVSNYSFYTQAQIAIDEGDLAKAHILLTKTSHILDSDLLSKKVDYDRGMIEYNNGNAYAARNYFRSAGDYEDAADWVAICEAELPLGSHF